jgi:CspA family cold shock protein
VKWFNTQKGYGFISPEGENAQDVFVHYADIQGEDFRTLSEGDVVEFEITQGNKGDKAIHVVRVETAIASETAAII